MDYNTTNKNYRPSQRAMKALHMIQNKSNTSLSTKIASQQSAWLPRPPLPYNLDPNISFNNDGIQNFDHHSNNNIYSISLVQTIKPVSVSQHLHNFSPISNKVNRLYSSPEASIPANGNYKKENDLMGIQQSSYITDDRTTITDDRANMLTEIVEELEELVDHNNTFKSMCFSLNDGRITSLVLTPDGTYCMAGFSTGSIRLFDLTADGNIDPEDRFGYQIGFIESSRGSVHVQLELGYSNGLNCCHLFAGACQGSTTMLAIDIGSLRDVHKKRGFITVAGGGVKVFQHSDARLKGLTALNTIQETTRSSKLGYSAVYHLITGKGFGSFHIWEITLEAKTTQTTLNSPLGMNNNVDGLVIDGLSYSSDWKHLYQGSINGPTMNFAHFINIHNKSNIYYTDRTTLWTTVQCSNGVSENNDFNKITNTNIDNTIPLKSSSYPSRSSLLLLVSDFQKDLRPILLSKSGDNPEAYIPISNNKAKVKDTLWTYAASSDGMILFGGKYELIVTFLIPACIHSNHENHIVDNNSNRITTNNSDSTLFATTNIVIDETIIPNRTSVSVNTTRIFSKVAFSLMDFISGAISSKFSKKGSRHLREIGNIWCTTDGAYAVILCSDNAVLLYSVCDITGKGSFPIHIEGDSVYEQSSVPINNNNNNNNNSSNSSIHTTKSPYVNTGGGFLTYLFEASSCTTIDLGISYIHKGHIHNESTSSSYCDCCISLSTALTCYKDRNVSRHRSPEDVLISIGWWLIENPLQGGVLKVCRLKSSIDSDTTHLSELFDQIIPSSIITSSLVLNDISNSNNNYRTNNIKNHSNTNRNKAYCFLCKDMCFKHWNDSDINSQEKTLLNLIQTSLDENNLNNKPSNILNTFSNNIINTNTTSSSSLITNPTTTATTSSLVQGLTLSYMDKNDKQLKHKRKDNKKEYNIEQQQQELQHNINHLRYSIEDNTQNNILEIKYPKKLKIIHHLSDNNKTSSIISNNTIKVNMIDNPKAYKENNNSNTHNEIINLDINLDDSNKEILDTIVPQDHIKESLLSSYQEGLTISLNNNNLEELLPNHIIEYNNDDNTDNLHIDNHYIDNNNIISNNTTNNTTSQLLIQEIERLKLENKRLRIDIDVSMRKADRRFAVELNSRRYWKKEKEELEDMIIHLEHDKQYLLSKFESTKKLSLLIQSILASSSDVLVKTFESVNHHSEIITNNNINQYNENDNSSTTTTTSNNNTSSFMSPKTNLITELNVITNYHTENKSLCHKTCNNSHSTNYVNNNNCIKSFFCTICFDHTANVAITPCGHVCLCTQHAIELQTICNNQMQPVKCPLCKVIAISFLSLQGIEPINTHLS